jgi:hypothetical protein
LRHLAHNALLNRDFLPIASTLRTTSTPLIPAILVPNQCLISGRQCAMPRVRLTDITISKLPQQKAQITYWDEGLPAFGVRVGARRKTFIVVVNGGHRIKLGNYPRTPQRRAVGGVRAPWWPGYAGNGCRCADRRGGGDGVYEDSPCAIAAENTQ